MSTPEQVHSNQKLISENNASQLKRTNLSNARVSSLGAEDIYLLMPDVLILF